jgi:2-C-methyl-D-erythritol 4-phosphate cytidylyltransferase
VRRNGHKDLDESQLATRSLVGRVELTKCDKITAVVLAGGMGRRTGLPVRKQFIQVGGMKLFEVSSLIFARQVDRVVLVVPKGFESNSDLGKIGKEVKIVAGGAERTDSVLAGLSEVETEYVLVHDAARPFVPERIILEIYELLEDGWDAVCPVMPVVDSIVRGDDEVLIDTPPRGEFRTIQTPQGFKTGLLARAVNGQRAGHFHLPEMIRREGGRVRHIKGDPWLFKVTYEPSVHLAEYYSQRFPSWPKRDEETVG